MTDEHLARLRPSTTTYKRPDGPMRRREIDHEPLPVNGRAGVLSAHVGLDRRTVRNGLGNGLGNRLVDAQENGMGVSPDWSHRKVLQADARSVAVAREFVRAHLMAHHLPHLVEDVRLVASELAANAVSHARTPFVVTLSQTEESVLLALEDGSSTTPFQYVPAVMDTRGRGLLIVAALSRDWGTSPGGHGRKSVWASFPSGVEDTVRR